MDGNGQMTGLRKILLCVALLILGGCKIYMSGHSPDYSMIVRGIGDLDVSSDIMVFQVVYEGLDITCAGKSRGRTDGTQGHEGGYKCSDGRSGGGKSMVTHMEGGTGAITDSCGNTFVYVWGINRRAIAAAGETYRQRRPGKSAVVADKCYVPKVTPAPTEQVERAEPPKPAVPASPQEQSLARLKMLRDQGLIDDAEYKAEKKKILGHMFAETSLGEPRAISNSAEFPSLTTTNGL